jgi:CRP/FNR family cyclic AMP-dependent transcriptional regulator
LLGPGDVLRPWQHDGSTSTLELEWTWRVVTPSRLAVLDARWTARSAAWPQLGAELTGRALARALRLVIAMAIAQQPRLDVRLWMLFWDLADRFGKVHPDGVHLDLPLTHEVLSHLAAARRPSVSGALTRLANEGRLVRSGRGWVLSGERPVLENSLV